MIHILQRVIGVMSVLLCNVCFFLYGNVELLLTLIFFGGFFK